MRGAHTFRHALAALCAVVIGSACATAARTAAPGSAATSAGSPRGSLVIAGGGPLGVVLKRRFVELAGGAGRARVVVFPMATTYAAEVGPEQAREFVGLGARAWVLDLTHEQAMLDSVARGLDSATGIWFTGGDQSRIMAVLRGSPVAEAVRARYRAGAVVGGTSAGAAVMTTPMITGDERRPGGDRPDTTQNWITITADNVVTAEGLALLDGAIVDQHFLRRRRHNRLLSLVLERPDLIGVGIDESTALVVEPNGWWSVIGRSAVIVYDSRRATVTRRGAPLLGARDVRLHVIPAGGRFDPRAGTVVLP